MVKAALALLVCSGCTLITESFATNDFSGDPAPIYVDTRSGAVLLGLTSQGRKHTAVIDVLSPLTLIDPGASVEATVDAEDITLLGDIAGNAGQPEIPRAFFEAQQVLRLHPCANTTMMCEVGGEMTEQPFDAILGADALSGDALRMRLGDNQVFVLADIGGSDSDRTDACDAVFPSPYRGGGTLIIAGTEVPFAGRRVTMQACLDPDPNGLIVQARRGTDALFVLSSSIGPSLLSESAYQRYLDGHGHLMPPPPPLSALPAATVSLPSGPTSGRLATIDRIALVGRATSEPLAPCRQFYAHHLLIERNCLMADDCPCEGGSSDRFCPVPASVDITPTAGIQILVVTDDHPTLQALRTEFRPTLQEIDGILGTGTIRDVELDVDYPHNRALARCADAAAGTCITRPAFDSEADRPRVRACPGIEITGI